MPSPFAFADVNARATAAGRAARDELARRLDAADAASLAVLQASSSWELLLTYCIEGPLNIAWYDRKIVSWRRRRSTLLVASLAVLLGMAALLVWRHSSDPTLAQASAALAALVACARILTGAADVKTQLGGFWKARADLKEQFLTFEQTWRGKLAADGAVAAGLEVALWQEIVNARHVVRAERDVYFSTFAAPGDILTLATSNAGDVIGRAREVNVARAARRQPIEDARQKLDQAKADRAAEDAKLRHLASKPAALDDESWRRARKDAELARAQADAGVARYTELMRSAAKAATFNP